MLDAYGLSANTIEPVCGGLINTTYKARGESGTPALALQRLHYIFPAAVNLDIEAITTYLATQHIPTPLLVRTRAGATCVEEAGEVWRAISWLEGHCYGRVDDAQIAKRGAELVGRFHRGLHGFVYEFKFARSGVHDTSAHLARLRAALPTELDSVADKARTLRHEIQSVFAATPPLPSLPLRICHGDLKISNLLFDDQGEGLCLIDLDTMGWQTIAYELGDALRSWGNSQGEDLANPQINETIIAAAAHGYAKGAAGLLTHDEIHSVILGLETVCLELAARFCLDVFEDRYFGWDPTHFASRREHNLARAKGQLALGQSVARQRDLLQSLWVAAF